MGIALNHPSLRSVGWYPPVDANWTTLESLYVARQKSDTSVVTVSGTTAETALMASATIPANTFQPGVVLDPWAFGNVTIPASSTPSVTFRLRWGGLAGTLLATYTWNFASQASAYQQGWNADSRLVCVTSGVTGTMEDDGWFAVGTQFGVGLATAVVTVDTTTDKVLLWTAQPSSALVTVTQRQMIVNRG